MTVAKFEKLQTWIEFVDNAANTGDPPDIQTSYDAVTALRAVIEWASKNLENQQREANRVAMRSRMRDRAPWTANPISKVDARVIWRERYERNSLERWKVTSRYGYEAGSNGTLLAVRIHCFGGARNGVVRHMSEVRFLRLFVPA